MSTVLVPVDEQLSELDAELVEQRDRLLVKLGLQRAVLGDLWQWYHGEQPVPSVAKKYKPAYKMLLELARTPWARLVVDAISERLHVQGFRAADAASEDAAWRLFVGSQLDADEWLVYTEALIGGSGYVSVGQLDGQPPRIAPESAFEVTHEPVPGDRRTVAAALKLFPLDWSMRSFGVELYRPEATYTWSASFADPLGLALLPCDQRDRQVPVEWIPADPFARENEVGQVTVIPFDNRATIIGGGTSELEDCIPILQRIDKLTLDKLLTSEFAAFRQKWATGLEVPKNEDGTPVEPYSAAVSKLWASENPNTKFGSFDASDLSPYLQAIDSEIAALAAISRVPAHYLIQTSLANPPSAESLIAGESGLVAKVKQRQRGFGEAWERALLLAFDLAGIASDGIEVVWADAEMRNPAQVADAAVKLQTIGVPAEALWEYVGATPQQVQEWSLESAASALTAAAV